MSVELLCWRCTRCGLLLTIERSQSKPVIEEFRERTKANSCPVCGNTTWIVEYLGLIKAK